MSKYADLDEAILDAVSRGRHRFIGIRYFGRVSSRANAHCDANGTEAFRLIDRRIQALRRSGRLTFTSENGWQITAASLASAPAAEGE